MFLKSEFVNELAKALCTAQSEIIVAKKDSSNPYFKSRYADLNSVWESCRAILVKNDLSVCQTLDSDANGSFLCTTLFHSSGQFITGKQKLNPVKDDPQSVGSAITYARRYGLAAIVGIVSDDDDDGESAMGRKSEVKAYKKEYAQPNTTPRVDTSKEDEKKKDLEVTKGMADKMKSVGGKKILAERMKNSGKYTDAEIFYATGVKPNEIEKSVV